MANESEKVVQVWAAGSAKRFSTTVQGHPRPGTRRVRTFTAIFFQSWKHVELTGEVHAERLAPCLEAMYCNVIPIVAGECLYFVF